jgi:calcineurin-like phosphoesterase family protein
MNEELISRWNNIVSINDIVYHLGDIGFTYGQYGNNTQDLNTIVSRLNGKIILFRGNHDKRNSMNPIIDSMKITYDRYVWELCHYPQEKPKERLNLCGHLHEKWKVKKSPDFSSKQGNVTVNVGVDVWDFKPVTMEEILKCVFE